MHTSPKFSNVELEIWYNLMWGKNIFKYLIKQTVPSSVHHVVTALLQSLNAVAIHWNMQNNF